MQDRSGRDAREDAFDLEQLAHTTHGIPRADAVASRQHRFVIELGDEALVEIAQPVHQLAIARFGRDDLHIGLVLTQESTRTHEGSGGAETCDEVRDRRKVGEELGACGVVMRLRIGGIAVLVQHLPLGMLLGHRLGDAHRLIRAARRRAVVHLRAPHAQQLRALRRGVLRHDAHEPVTALLGDHGQGDAGVPRGRLEEGVAGCDQTVAFGSGDHRQRGAILHRSRGIAVLELGPQSNLGRRRESRQADERRVPDGVEEGVEAHAPLSRRRRPAGS